MTKEQVARAVQELRQAGQQVSQNSVIKRIGGSKRDVAPLLKAVLEEEESSPGTTPAPPGTTPLLPPVATQAEERLAQTEAHLGEAERALDVAKENLLHVNARYLSAWGVLVQGERHGAALDLDDPLREPIKRSWEIAQQEYAQAKAALLEACAQVGAAHRAVQEAHQDTLREERHSWLVQNDPEYRSILEQVAEYEQACAETQGKLEQRGNHARNQYLLREVRAAQERKLNAPTH